MARYSTNEASFDLPDHFEDRSMHIFASPTPAESDTSLVITLGSCKKGESRDAYVERQISELSATLPELEVLDRRPATVAELPATELRIRWRGPRGLVHQTQVLVTPPNHRGLVFTATSPKADSAITSVLKGALDSLKLNLKGG